MMAKAKIQTSGCGRFKAERPVTKKLLKGGLGPNVPDNRARARQK
jgi:hypothetical protein